MKNTRIEHDLLGEMEVPAYAYYGIHTLRALENFPISGIQINAYTSLIRSLAFVKHACALANLQFGALEANKVNPIVEACIKIENGRFHDQFVVDVIQGGAGTSTNMNANEVIANIGLELLNLEKGNYSRLHPLEDVNKSQSTNDVYPTAIKIALNMEIQLLDNAMDVLIKAFESKAAEFSHILKVGRTQLQDAVPMTLGQEFKTYAIMLREDQQRLREATRLIEEINLGATAIGTGITAPKGYSAVVCNILSELTGIALIPAENLIEATQDAGAFVQLSGVLKRIAVKLSKTCNDLRLLSSGPRTGFNEINLPPVQAGSSIMPGKVNPVIPEVVNQIAFEVIGNDMTITMAAEAGQLQLNAFEPIIARNLFNSINFLKQGCLTLAKKSVIGITANETHLKDLFDNSISMITALNPIIGYEKATFVAKESFRTGRSVKSILLENKILNEDEIDKAFSIDNLIK